MRIISELKKKALLSLREHDSVACTLYRTLIGEAENAAKKDKTYSAASDKQREEIENKVLLAKLKSFREDVGTTMQQAGDPTGKLANELQVYNALWEQYAPKLMDEAATTALVKECIAGGQDTLPKIMATLNKSHRGQLDNALVRKIAESLI